MEGMEMLPEEVTQAISGIIPFFNLDKREDLLKRRRMERLSRTEATRIKHIKQARAIGKAGLKLYNETKGVNYELVLDDNVRSNWFMVRYVDNSFLHGNFKAREADDGTGKSNPVKLFFAEVTIKEDMIGLDALNCCIIDESDTSKFTRGFVFCAKYIVHDFNKPGGYCELEVEGPLTPPSCTLPSCI